jgi:hypothetical protein
MARSQKFKLANYDGGFSSRPKRADSGTLEILGDATWRVSLKGAIKPAHGSLASWSIRMEPTSDSSCRVTMQSDDGAETAAFELPEASEAELQQALDEQQPKVDAGREKQAQILGGEWWLDESIFKGLGITGQWTAADTTYHGGLTSDPKSHQACIVKVDKKGVSLSKIRTYFTIPWSEVTALEVEGPEQAAQRFTATRLVLLGPLGLAFKKSKKTTVILVSTRSGDQAVFETKKYQAHEVKPKLQAIINKIQQANPEPPEAVPTLEEPAPPAPPVSAADEIAKLVALRDSGAITDEEFMAYKANLLP